jgi:hypothetical protein
VCSELGLDSARYAGKRFDQYGTVQYKFNSLGFRTHELGELDSESVVVFGDSFTLGLGVNASERFSDIMQQQLNRKVFNISLNGASNNWIARRVADVLELVTPWAIVIHYTFSHRREHADTSWHDDERTLCEATHSDQENYASWQQNFESISKQSCKIVHSFIPNWHPGKVEYPVMQNLLLPCTIQDRARDGFHYGIKTHQYLAQQFTSLLAV